MGPTVGSRGHTPLSASGWETLGCMVGICVARRRWGAFQSKQGPLWFLVGVLFLGRVEKRSSRPGLEGRVVSGPFPLGVNRLRVGLLPGRQTGARESLGGFSEAASPVVSQFLESVHF